MRDLIGALLPRLIRNDAPVPYTGRRAPGIGGMFGRGGPANREQQAGAMTANGTLYAIVGGIAEDVAAVEWHLHRIKPGSQDRCPRPRCDKVGVELVEAHAALDVWNTPNPFMGGQEYREVVQQHQDLTGEGWNLFARSALVDWPIELWPIYPHRMEPMPDAQKYLAEYVYSSPDGEKVPLGLRDVALMRRPHPLDFLRGLGAVQTIGVDLETARASGQWNRNFFLNSAEPGGIIEVEKRLSDTEFDEMVTRWREQHQGVANAHRVAVLEQGKWVDRKYTMRDMQFVELRGISREAIREAYRYPVAMLGESKDVNRAVAEAQKAFYAELILVPRLARWKGMLNTRFLPAFGATATGLEFAYDSPIPSDRAADNAERASRAEAFKHLVEAGVNGTEALAAYGLPDMEWVRPERITGGSGGGWGWNTAGPERLLAVNTGAEPAAADRMSPAGIAGMIQKLYLGTPERAVVTWEEARTILNAAGAELDLGEPPPATTAPEPQPGGHQAPPPTDAARPHLPHLGVRRARNTLEIRASVDHDVIHADWQAAVDDLHSNWDRILDEQLDQLHTAIRIAVNAGDVAALAALSVGSADGADLLAGAMADLAAKADARVVAEAAAQGVTIGNRAVVNAGTWAAVASAVAALVTSGVVASAVREALRWVGYGRDGGETADAAVAQARVDSEAPRRRWFGGALWRAGNQGRIDAMRRAPQAKYYASEVLDASTCAKCEAIDGKELPSIEAANLAYGGGGYLFCLGLDRCRGMMIAVWE